MDYINLKKIKTLVLQFPNSVIFISYINIFSTRESVSKGYSLLHFNHFHFHSKPGSVNSPPLGYDLFIEIFKNINNTFSS